jgi:hypothetical protein
VKKILKVQTLDKTIKYKVLDNQKVRVKETGNIIELMHSENRPSGKIYIKKISGTEYVDIRTGDIIECKHIENRSQNLDSVRRSLGRLRDYINTNCVKNENCKWVTLTYAENMTDTKKLYNDFVKFNKRMQYKLGKYEYIIACEPQGRGAWHIHMLMIFESKAPFIKNEDMYQVWSHGWTTTKALDENINNVGSYLTAYLGDFDFSQIESLTDEEKFGLNGKWIKDVEVTDIDGKKISKKIVKGGRLHMYPAKFNLYRCSKGIKKPEIYYTKEKKIQKKIKASSAKLTFERTITITDDTKNFSNTLNYRYYNSIADFLNTI